MDYSQIILIPFIIANIIIYPLLSMFLLAHYPLWILITHYTKRKDKGFILHIIKDGWAYILAVFLTIPYMLSVAGGVKEPLLQLRFWDQSIRNLFAFWLPYPLIILGMVMFFKSSLEKDIKILMFSGFIVAFIFATFMELPHWNSIKFTYILSYFYAIFFIIAVSRILSASIFERIKPGITIAIILFLCFTPLLTETAYLISPWFNDNEFSFSGRHIAFNQHKERNEAYEWIRKNTRKDAILILNFVTTMNPDKIAQNDIYMYSAVTERNLFIIRDWYTESLPEFSERLMIRERILRESDPELKEFFRKLNRPVYLFIEDYLPENYVIDIKNRMVEENGNFKLVFKNDFQRIYRLEL
ncbi:MAG: hypothetical protein Fur0020_02010 [Thermodesulfovibrionia bacterium]